MAHCSGTVTVDEQLDQAVDAVARNEWPLARRLAESVLEWAPNHQEARLILRTADAYLATQSAPSDPLAGSRDLRFMSIMFCDVVGSKRIAQDLGDAVWRETLERFRRRCARAVRRYDGFIHEASGDEILILFGYPRLREDDARRAVLAGLDIIEAIRSFSDLLMQEHAVSFHIRVGVHTGHAFIREAREKSQLPIGDEPIGGALFGEAANVSKCVESEAEADTVWVSEVTRRIIDGFFEFSLEACRHLEVGHRRVTAYRVEGPTAALNRHQIARVRSDDMVGRSAERQRLVDLWSQAKADGAPIVLVSGQAGIGKSRLVEFLAETAAAGTASRLECICTQILTPVAFGPLVGLLERFANIRQADSPETRLAKLGAAFLEHSPEFASHIPYLASMMSIRQREHQHIDELEPETIRVRIFDSLLNALILAVRLRPSVFWIEDVQWADHSTREFCRRLQAHGPIPGLMVVATWRTEHDRADLRLPWVDDDEPGRGVVRLPLAALSKDESRQLIVTRAGGPCDARLTETILESAGGNPLYLEEVVRSVAAGGTIPHEAAAGNRNSIAVPDSLHPIFAQIVDGLGADRPVAQVAALLGRDLPEPLTRTVVGYILGMTQDDVVSRLSRLIEAEVIEPQLTGPSAGYRFRHELIRESLVQSVGANARQNHRRLAEAIEHLFPEFVRERPDVLAFHYGQAEQHDHATAYHLSAGLALQAKAAHLEALAAFEQGLASLARVTRRADATAMAKLELALRASRGVSLQTVRGYTDPTAGTDWERAYEISKQMTADTALVPAMLGLWSFNYVRGVHTTAIEVAMQMVDAAVATDDPESSLIAHVCLGYSRYWQGDLIAARASTEHGLSLVEQLKGRPSLIHVPQDPALTGLILLAILRWSGGDQLGALQAARESEATAQAMTHRWAINVVRTAVYTAWFHQIRRDPKQAIETAERALAVAMSHGIDWAVVNLMIHKGLALAHLDPTGGGLNDGAVMAETNLGYWRAGGAETMVPYFLGQLAEAHLRASSYARALAYVDEAIAVAIAIGERCHDAELYRIRGEARLAIGSRQPDGLADLREAIAIARRQQATSFEIRAIVTLLQSVPDLSDRGEWLHALPRVVARLTSDEGGSDTRAAAALIEGTRWA